MTANKGPFIGPFFFNENMKINIFRQTKNQKRNALLDVLRAEVLRNGGTLRLLTSVRVTADDCGIDIPVNVRRIRKLYPDAPDECRCFDIGEGFNTDHLDEAALRSIVRSIKP